jgi:hypothetical protein
MLLLVLFLSCFADLFAQTSSKDELQGFRDISFGMSIKQVKSIEKAKFVSDEKNVKEETLHYEARVQGMDCNIYYNFIENRFMMGYYEFKEKHSSNNQYLIDYENIVNYLKEHYGKPDTENHKWIDSTYKNEENKWGDALSVGAHEYVAIWTFSNGAILTDLKGDNNFIVHNVFYYHEAYTRELEQIRKSDF